MGKKASTFRQKDLKFEIYGLKNLSMKDLTR